MRIEITKRERRSRLTCVRADGSRTTADVGPALPYHDLSHYVVETRMGLQHGFFGHVASGYSLQALADKTVISSLPPESWTAEILARGLGALATGAATPEQFSELVNAEIEQRRAPRLENLSAALAASMLAQLEALVGRYDALPDGGSLRLEFA
jgi:hypothetical protein